MASESSVESRCLTAFEKSNYQEAVRLLPSIKEPKQCTWKGGSNLGLLHLAVLNGWLDVVKNLITEHGCDPMVANNNGFACLHLAVLNNHIDIVKYLITDCDPMVANNNGFTCLHLAVRNNHIDIVKYLITEHGCDPMIADNDGDTCLHLAVLYNHIDIVKYLISEHGCDPMVANNNCNTCLHLAVLDNHIDIVKYLITEHGCDPMVANNYSNTCLHLAVLYDHIDIVKYLITEHGCDPMVATKYGNTCLHLAALNNHIDIVKYLITEHGCDPMVANNDGNTCLRLALSNNYIIIAKYLIKKHCYEYYPMVANNVSTTCLHLAVLSNHIDIVKCLITEHGCDPMVANNDGNTSLHLAVRNNHIDIVKCLITEHGCDPMVTDNDGNTCLHLAVWNNQVNIDIIKCLITEHGCDPMVTDNDGNTCLHLAVWNNHIDIVKYLITEHGCDPMVTDDHGNSCLQLAVWNNHVDIVKYLITENCCDLMITDDDGNTCLHLAVWNNHIDIAKYLITEHGCDPMIADDDGNTCLHLAVWNNNIDIAKYLITEHGCDPMVANNDGSTCLHLAVLNNYIDIVKYLITEHICDPMVADIDGISCLQLAVLNNRIDIVKYLITEIDSLVATKYSDMCLQYAVLKNHIDLVKYLLTKYHYYPMVKVNWFLHFAVLKNHIDIVKYLITEHGCDPMVADNDGDTCLHIAVRKCHIDIVKYLITEHGCDPMVVNNMNRTPLHIAVKHQHLAIIECLLSTGKVNLLAKDIDNMTPLKLAINNKDIQFLFTKFGKIKTSRPVDSYVNVLLLGNPGVGKSTLAGVITDRSKGVLGGRFRYVKDIQLYTAGIIPAKLQHKELGNIILHDFAGHSEYYSSHTAVIENLLQGSGAVFIIVVDITSKDSSKHLQQWLTIVNNEVYKCTSQCHIIVAVSHIDEVTDITTKNEKIEKLFKIIKLRCDSQVSLLSLDCRKLGGGSMNSLFNELSGSCQSIRSTSGRNLSLYCHMMYGFLEESQQNIFSLTDINSTLNDEYILPKERGDILEILTSLHSIGLICLLKSQKDIGNIWVIVNKQILLAEVNGILFAPEFFEQYHNVASNTGIITSSSLIHLFPDYNIEILMCFFINMALCQEINPQFLKESNLNARDSLANESYLFFPALLDVEKPIDINGKVFKFSWCLQCVEVYHFFPSRFFHILTLNLAYKYGLPDSTSSFNCQCTFWRNGIHFNRDGVETLVEMVDDSQSVLVLMSCEEMCEIKMISLRKRIIKEVMDVQKESYPSLMVLAYVIDSDELTYPIDKPTQRRIYKVADISECITNGREYVNSTPHYSGDRRTRKIKKIKDLLNNECTTDVSELSILGKDTTEEEDEDNHSNSLTKSITCTTTNDTEVSSASGSECTQVSFIREVQHLSDSSFHTEGLRLEISCKSKESMSQEETLFQEHREMLMSLLSQSLSKLTSLASQKDLISYDLMEAVYNKDVVDLQKQSRSSLLVSILCRKIDKKVGNPQLLIQGFLESIEELHDMHKYLSDEYKEKKRNNVSLPERQLLLENGDRITKMLEYNIQSVASKLKQSGTVTSEEYNIIINPHEKHDQAAIAQVMENIGKAIRQNKENMKKFIEILEDIGGPVIHLAEKLKT